VKEKLIRKVRRNRKDFIRLFLSPVELSKGPPSLPRKATIKSIAAVTSTDGSVCVNYSRVKQTVFFEIFMVKTGNTLWWALAFTFWHFPKLASHAGKLKASLKWPSDFRSALLALPCPLKTVPALSFLIAHFSETQGSFRHFHN
jgi:hypothetical protein